MLRSSFYRSGASLSSVLFDAKGHQGLLEEECTSPHLKGSKPKGWRPDSEQNRLTCSRVP